MGSIKQSSVRFEHLLEGLGVGAWDWILDKEDMEYWSPLFYEILGYENLEIQPSIDAFKALLHPDDREATKLAAQNHWEKRSPFDVKYRLKCKNGKYRWFRATGKTVYCKNNKPYRMYGTIEDIDEKEVERIELESAKSILQETMNEVYVFDLDTYQFQYANNGGLKNIGYNIDEMLQLTPIDIKPNFTKESFEELVKPLKDGKINQLEFSTIHERKDNTQYDVQVTLQILPYHGKLSFCAIIFDISNLKQAQAKQIQEFTEILSATPSCLKLIDKEGKLINMNEQGLDLIEAPDLNSVFKANVYDIVEESHRQKFMDFNKKICAGEKGTLTFEIIGLKGTRRWMETYAAPFKFSNGEIGHLAITNDISQKIQAEEEYKQQKAIALHQSKLASIGELAAGVGHEINNPLSIAKGYISTIKKRLNRKEGLKTDDLLIYLEKINMATDRIVKIVQGLRTFSRSDSTEVSDFNPYEAVKETFEMIDEIFEKEGIKIFLKTEIEESNFLINGNRGKFQQILMNLLTNAKDAVAQKPYKTIKLFCDYKDNNLTISISDNGHGIEEHLLDKIFDPFFTTKDVNQGTGIGLSLVHNFIKEFNGDLSIETELDVGSTFHLKFPVSISDTFINPNLAEVSEQDHSKKYIGNALLVDDEEEIRVLLTDILEEYGLKVTAHKNGLDALEAFKNSNHSFDIIISDMKMPEMDGPELLKQIRSIKNIKQPKIIFVTGGITVNFEDKNSEINKSIDGYFLKPFDEDDVLKTLNECFD